MTYSMRLNELPFEKIRSGEKTVELRLNDEKRQALKIGDTIIFENRTCPQKTVTATVRKLWHFDNFDELFAVLPLKKCGFPENGKAADMLEYYSAEEQRKYGVVGIEISVNG